ncbi:RNA polymerase sigma factor [uncultured Bacteroides sp.]|uniref:RNA polymerase sigma factor n=1 Tax=uncultured Bacteroides sp. TaxID=162156 RepID=UPI002AAA8DA2|nr:RNA polymerase sigma factor [uncultured Bacteroides sp.]
MDADTFKKKYLPFHQKLYYIAYQLLENEADAEDLIQEAYLKLWDKRKGLSAIKNPEAFSVTLVKNMCFDILRSGKHIIERKSVELTTIQETATTENLETKDEIQQVKQLINCLPEQQRKVILLKDVKGCSFEEVEKITGLNSINVRVLLSRGRKKIRERFNKLNNYESGKY